MCSPSRQVLSIIKERLVTDTLCCFSISAPGSTANAFAIDNHVPGAAEDQPSMWGWFKGTVNQIARNDLVHNLVEKTKVIKTFEMHPFLSSHMQARA